MQFVRRAVSLIVFVSMAGGIAAWDYSGHRCVNLLAFDGLPGDFPKFVKAPEARERIAFLAGEPDRWRNVTDLTLKHYNALDHYIDVEDLAEAGLDPKNVSPMRYQFAVDFAAGRKRFAKNFQPIDDERNADHTQEWPGFLPWSITEYYGKLKSAFSQLRTLEEFGGGEEEIQNVRENIVYLMGVMGHYVGDAGQPLHTTRHFNGWIGANPRGYSTWKRFHQWVDGGYIFKAGIGYRTLERRVRPATILFTQPDDDEGRDAFDSVMSFVIAQNQRVEPLYKLDKARKLQAGDDPVDPDGVGFIEEQLLRAAGMLSSLWFTAWQNAEIDGYLRSRLEKKTEVQAAESMAR
jgi:hypothetical protein